MLRDEFDAERSGEHAATATLPPPGELEADYRRCMALALSRLHREFPAIADDERLELYDEVWAQLLERRSQSGFWPDRLEPYLVAAVVKRARFEHRTRSARRTDPSDALDELPVDVGSAIDERVIEALDAQNYTAIIESLSPLQRTVPMR